MFDWKDAIIYHIYPLGLLDALQPNDFSSAPADKISGLTAWAEHARGLGANTLYLGPVFESTFHGYDTADYFRIDRRLGTHEAFRNFTAYCRSIDLKVVLDGVFHHTGRNFWAFRKLKEEGPSSRYSSWFAGINWNQRNAYGDPFSYDTWNGCADLVKLNLNHPDVKEHLFQAAEFWMDEFGIDGLRLDAADVLDIGFQKELSRRLHAKRKDFWLMGEVIHGDYRRWANPETLDSVTNYECFKGLYSSLNDRNYFEIAYSLNRQFGPEGIYRGLNLYSFADNHDVNRVASLLKEKRHLYPLYLLLFTMPGVPSLYYGSEFGIPGERSPHDDRVLRPALSLDRCRQSPPEKALEETLRRFSSLRKNTRALREGSYRQAMVSHEQFAFFRELGEKRCLIVLNASDQKISVTLPRETEGNWRDLLNPGESFTSRDSALEIPLYPNWGRVLELEK